jgi:diguanylate cyclase (GGDEF)-like protein
MKFWKNFLARERRTERSQAVARLMITCLVGVYLFVDRIPDPESPFWSPVSLSYVVFLAYSIAHYLWILRWPQPMILRRGLAIVADMGTTSLLLYMLGESGAFLYAVYLWVIVGNGLRFGVRYLLFALAVALVGFAIVGRISPFWSEHGELVAGLLIGMGVLPLFFATLLRELERTNRNLAELVERTSHAAQHDPLTGLANRQLLFDRLSHTIELARRRDALVAVLFIDLDGFKDINDTLGHGAGDELLRQIAQRLRETLRRADTVARYGGDEFVILLEDLRNDRNIHTAIRRTASIFAQPYVLNGKPHRIHGSIGVSMFPRDGGDAETLLQQADRTMYEAKKQGGNRVHGFPAPERGAGDQDKQFA